MAILLPSANNIAVLVARQIDSSVASFVAEMNHTAHTLGMAHTTYTDPSGYDTGTLSTALDQLRLAQVVAEDETLAAMMATRSYSLPVAGEVTNTDTLLGHDGFIGMKTGSDDAAGGCFMFRSERHTESGNVALIGVVLGQQGHNLITAGLYAARQLVDRLAPNTAPPESGTPVQRHLSIAPACAVAGLVPSDPDHVLVSSSPSRSEAAATGVRAGRLQQAFRARDLRLHAPDPSSQA
jgi:D-alanyl-D-alanine carboxypeptidase